MTRIFNVKPAAPPPLPTLLFDDWCKVIARRCLETKLQSHKTLDLELLANILCGCNISGKRVKIKCLLIMYFNTLLVNWYRFL